MYRFFANKYLLKVNVHISYLIKKKIKNNKIKKKCLTALINIY